MEKWTDVPGYEGCYSVSDMGRVRSEPRTVSHLVNGKVLKGRIIRSRINKQTGYPAVNLSMRNVRKTFPIHVLVATAFIGCRPFLGAVVCHIDGNKTNPSLANLRYGTSQDNANDAFRHGTIACGERLKRSRLTEADIRKIRIDGRLQKDIALDYGVGISAISNIQNRVSWRHVK